MPDTVVLLSARWGSVLPAAALPALLAADEVLADGSVPAELAVAVGAAVVDKVPPVSAGAASAEAGSLTRVVLTTDPAVARRAEHMIVSPEPPGAVLLDAVAVMDRLRSPGGCPWDAEQTHASLLPYLIEEAYELHGAVEDGDPAAMREELGDVLLQVLFHSRLAQEQTGSAFTIDEVASGLVGKLVARHPHVFAPPGLDAADDPTAEVITTAADQQRRWEELKGAEKQRRSCVDGVPLTQPAAALAAKLVSRASRAGWPPDLVPDGVAPGERLLALVADLKLAGVEPEGALRTAARGLAGSVRAAEEAARAAGEDPAQLTAAQWRRYWPG